MFCEDQETLNALNALSSVVDHKRPPLVLWLGAGARITSVFRYMGSMV